MLTQYSRWVATDQTPWCNICGDSRAHRDDSMSTNLNAGRDGYVSANPYIFPDLNRSDAVGTEDTSAARNSRSGANRQGCFLLAIVDQTLADLGKTAD